MLIDCHVHVSALLPNHGLMSAKILKSFPFRFMQSRLGINCWMTRATSTRQ
jgi:hypothetical protein